METWGDPPSSCRKLWEKVKETEKLLGRRGTWVREVGSQGRREFQGTRVFVYLSVPGSRNSDIQEVRPAIWPQSHPMSPS